MAKTKKKSPFRLNGRSISQDQANAAVKNGYARWITVNGNPVLVKTKRILPVGQSFKTKPKKKSGSSDLLKNIGIGAAVVGGALLAAKLSKIRTISTTAGQVVRSSGNLFSRGGSISVRRKIAGPFSLRVAKADFSFNKKRKRVFVDSMGGIDKKSNIALLKGIKFEAQKRGATSVAGSLVNPKLAKSIKKRGGKLILTSESGSKIVGSKAAAAEITRLIRGRGRAVVTGSVRLKKKKVS